MTYRSAVNFCESHGTTLFSLSDFDCASFSNETTGFCCATDDGNCSDDRTTQSPTMQAFRKAYRSTHEYWTSTIADRCYIERVYMYNGRLGKQNRAYSIDFYALCK